MKHIAPYWKAIVGFIAPGAALVVAALLPESDGGSVITQAEALRAVAVCFVTGGAVYAGPSNKPVSGNVDEV